MKKFFLLFFTMTSPIYAMDKKRSNSCPPPRLKGSHKLPIAAPDQMTPRYSPQDQMHALSKLMEKIQRNQPDGNLLAYLLTLQAEGKLLQQNKQTLEYDIKQIEDNKAGVGAIHRLSLFGQEGLFRRRKSSLDKEIEQNRLERYLLAKKLDEEQKTTSSY